MYAVCLRYAADEHEAQDMLQEGFIKLFGNLGQFANKGSFDGWVRRIFVHTAIKYYHRMRKHHLTEEVENYRHYVTRSDVVDDLSASELMELVRHLPHGYRMVFNLYAIEGYSHKEIADQLEIGESTSRSQLVKARKLLQEKVNAQHKSLV